MKNYDDLQRFKEKTQTLDIAFKDMSGQTQEAAEHSKWSLIRQLASDAQQNALGGGQRIDLPQPQPLRGDEFSAPAPAALPRQSTLSAQPATAARGSILDSLAGSAAATNVTAEAGSSSLFPPPLLKPTEPVATLRPAAVQPAAVANPPTAFTSSGAANPPTAFASSGAANPPTAFASSEAANRAEPGRFGALFRSRGGEPVNLPKETLLKPLLEKIALCR
ncbi:cellulose biosynthesis protein BcsO [Pantoea brenneri]|uniref:cellulose biosynthesis protein BcsO n=1 Tax=Pantoea brenneri TaxID=472694 RepID=UPI0028A25D10|nr:cellulose biosynthesis protein BcsO [Pantoea brenneri]